MELTSRACAGGASVGPGEHFIPLGLVFPFCLWPGERVACSVCSHALFPDSFPAALLVGSTPSDQWSSVLPAGFQVFQD